ncbi:TonB-dependent siderophore receptor [Pseudomonas sp. ABC1]|uniref:TonB-dependent siderophore receptor n=1 Tax=Pseudomonas sp. ABC1 TaxID=2748080 RepID=UPI0015C36CC5|nr:TonB-dependent siderophore receptor [Pseudomonas sp. ABC1]
MRKHPRPSPLARLVRNALFGLSLPLAGVPTLTLAAPQHYSIPASSLENALNAFARQNGVLLSFDPALTAGYDSKGLDGNYHLQEGFTRLLEGTGLRLLVRDDGSYGLGAVSSALELSSVDISGKAPGSITEGTGSYTTYSTSSSTRMNLTPQETPQAITVLTRQRLDDQKLDTLIDALEATPGIFVQKNSIGRGEDSIDIYARGSRLRNYQIDGVPTSAAVAPFLTNTATYDRIEVIRGATGIMNGLGTPAATVNLLRKRPTETPQSSVTAQAGRWDRYGLGLDTSGALNDNGTARARFVADSSQHGAWVDNFDQQNLALYGIGELDLSDQTLLTIGFSHMTQKTDSPIQGRPLFFSNGQRIKLSPEDSAAPKWSHYDQDSNSVFTSLEHRIGANWVAKVEYSHTRYRKDLIEQGISGSIDAATGNSMELSPWHSKGETRQDNLDAYTSGIFSLFGREHELITGVTLTRGRSRSDNFDHDPTNYPTYFNIYDWAKTAPKPTFINTGKSSSQERLYSAFLNARFQLSDATSLLLGGRSADWKLDETSSQRKEEVFVPYVGLVQTLDDIWSVYGSYTKIFQPQDGVVYLYGAPGASPDPEQGEGYEVGVKAGFYDGRLTSSLALFQMDVENLAFWNRNVRQYQTYGETRTRGVELELNGELTTGWQAGAGYAYARSEDENGERTLRRLPSHSLKLFTTYRLPGHWDKATIGGGVNW